jgi:hypothetical protein
MFFSAGVEQCSSNTERGIGGHPSNVGELDYESFISCKYENKIKDCFRRTFLKLSYEILISK